MNSAATATQQRPAQAPPREVARPKSRAPIGALFAVAIGFAVSIVTSVFIGTMLEIAGMYTLWPAQGASHARQHVDQDLGYIAQFPRAVLVPDTVAFARRMAEWARWPFDKLGVPGLIERASASKPDPARGRGREAIRRGYLEVLRWVEIFYYVAQDTAIRLSVAVFAVPAFCLAMLVGFVDGLVKRDLRKWCGGRESSFVYHHAKNYTGWFLTGGFALYLAWPFHGFNPTYMVLVFTVLVAISLSVTVAAFKKYL